MVKTYVEKPKQITAIQLKENNIIETLSFILQIMHLGTLLVDYLFVKKRYLKCFIRKCKDTV